MKSTAQQPKTKDDLIVALEDARTNLGRQFMSLVERWGQRDPADDPHSLLAVAAEVLHSRQLVAESICNVRRLFGGRAA
jgi:hypothetical protein